MSGDRHEFGLKVLTVDACCRVALRAGERASTQAPIDVDRTVSDDLCAVADRCSDREIATARINLLARANRPGVVQTRACGRKQRALAAGLQGRRMARARCGILQKAAN